MNQEPRVRRKKLTVVPIKSKDLTSAEVSWFAPLCSDDFRYLGVPESGLRSNWQNTSKILQTADEMGFRNILCPSSYQVGQDTLSFVASSALLTKNINMLAAVRCGELHPIMLARTIATLDHLMEGRLTINIISSDFPGEKAESSVRYQRSREVVQILKQAWTQQEISFSGQHYDFSGLSTAPVKPYQQNGGPLLYFGGYSPSALELCGEHCDVYLMWPEKKEDLAERMKAVNLVAHKYNRAIDYGLRIHVIARDTETEAREYAKDLVSRLDDEVGKTIRERALDATSLGVNLQAENREKSDQDGYVEPHLWTGIGRARSGCGAALVGSVDQVLNEIEEYKKMGIRSFIFSGYPHLEECISFGKKVLPKLDTCSLPKIYDRVPHEIPNTPLGVGERI